MQATRHLVLGHQLPPLGDAQQDAKGTESTTSSDAPLPHRPDTTHQREAAVEGLISLSQLPPRSPAPRLAPLPRKRKFPPSTPHGDLPPSLSRHVPAKPAVSRSLSSPSPSPSSASSHLTVAPPPTPGSAAELRWITEAPSHLHHHHQQQFQSSPPRSALPTLGRVMAPYISSRCPPPANAPPALKRLRTTTTTTTTTATPTTTTTTAAAAAAHRHFPGSSDGVLLCAQQKQQHKDAMDRSTGTSSNSLSPSAPASLVGTTLLLPSQSPLLAGPAEEGKGQEEDKEEEDEKDESTKAMERERLAVERCLDLGVERSVVEALSTAGVSAERIVELILSEDKEQREGIIRGTGLSKNYIMKLQRRALRTSAHLQLPAPLTHPFPSGLTLHVLFDSHDRALFIKKELCRTLNMKGTTFSYWKKKAGVSDIDTSQDFRLMDKCRSIFGGRSTYTLYSAEQMLIILQCMQHSRQKNCFTNVSQLTALIASYHDGAPSQPLLHSSDDEDGIDGSGHAAGDGVPSSPSSFGQPKSCAERKESSALVLGAKDAPLSVEMATSAATITTREMSSDQHPRPCTTTALPR